MQRESPLPQEATRGIIKLICHGDDRVIWGRGEEGEGWKQWDQSPGESPLVLLLHHDCPQAKKMTEVWRCRVPFANNVLDKVVSVFFFSETPFYSLRIGELGN